MSSPFSLSRCVRRSWALALALCLWIFCSAAPLRAVVYDLPYAYGSDFAFSLTVDGEGVEEVDKRLQVDEMERPRANLILFGVGRVNLKMTARYIGSRPLVQGSVRISMLGSDVAPYCHWTTDGATATATVDLYTYVALERINLFLMFEATANVSNDGGATYVTTSKSGYGSIYLRKPMTLHVNVLDAMLEISAHKPHPAFSSEVGDVVDDFVQDPLDGVGIKIQRTANRIRVPKTDWTLTTQNKFLGVPIGAPLNSIVDPAKKAVLDDIVVYAVKERTRLAVIEPVELPFAQVVEQLGGYRVENYSYNGGTLIDLPVGSRLAPGEWIQAGSAVSPNAANIKLRYCDGTTITLTAENYQGQRVRVGEDSSLIGQRSALGIQLQAAWLQATTWPRETAGILVVKGLRMLADETLPETNCVVGKAVDEAGNALEEYAINTIRRIPPDPAPLPGGGGSSLLPGSGAADGSLPPDGDEERYALRFYNNGSFKAENSGASIRIAGPGWSREVLPGCQTMVYPQLEGSHASSVATLPPVVPNPGESLSLLLSPLGGSSVANGTSVLECQFPGAENDPMREGTFRAWVDGRLCTANFSGGRWAVPAYAPLARGTHVFEAEVVTATGRRVSAVSSFTVTALSMEPTGLQVVPAPGRVALRWVSAAAAARHEVARAATADGPWTVLTPAGGTTQDWFVDGAPLASGVYRVTPFGADGFAGDPVVSAPVAWPGDAPAASDALAGLALVPSQSGIRIDFTEPSLSFCLWKVERGTSAEGPFTEVAPGGRIASAGWIDTTAPEGLACHYRVTPENAAGVAGTPLVAGPATRPSSLVAPEGLCLSHDADGVYLRWDPCAAEPLSWRLYRRTMTSDWTLAQTVSGGVHVATEPLPASDEVVAWRISAVRTGGIETPPSEPVVFASHRQSASGGAIAMVHTAVDAAEGTQAVVTIGRSGGSADAAFVHYCTRTPVGTTATEGTDYTQTGGILVFEPGETQKTVSIPVAHDTLAETPAETFKFEILSVEGAALMGFPNAATVTIHDPDILSWTIGQADSVSEAMPSVTLSVTRTWPSQRTVTIDYAVDAVRTTAVAGGDYVSFGPGTLTFLPGETRKTITIGILDDTLKEPTPPLLYITLSNPGGGATLAGNLPDWHVAITDDDNMPGRIRFVESQAEGMENGGGITLHLERVDGTEGQLIAFITDHGGTAFQWSDWTAQFDPEGPPGMPIFFADGQKQASITMPVLDDALIEGAEFVVLGVYSMDSANRASPESCVVVTIKDDEPRPSTLATWLASQPEGRQGALDDGDADGQPNLVEYAFVQDPAQSSPPAPRLEMTQYGYWAFTLDVRDDPGFIVYAEFDTDPSFANPMREGGYWDDPSGGTRHVVFRCPFDASTTPLIFGRIVVSQVSP